MSTSKKEWMKDPNFIKLCDIVARNNLICLTGAGVSKGLKLKNGNTAPDWKQLLSNIKKAIDSKLSKNEKDDLNTLLTDEPPGEYLIEASSILCSKDKNQFLKELSDSVDLEIGATSLTHQQLLQLSPRGILTYNYDEAHENAIKKNSAMDNWEIVLPSENTKIIEIMKNNLRQPFLDKIMGKI